jgi:hypothetical protein
MSANAAPRNGRPSPRSVNVMIALYLLVATITAQQTLGEARSGNTPSFARLDLRKGSTCTRCIPPSSSTTTVRRRPR